MNLETFARRAGSCLPSLGSKVSILEAVRKPEALIGSRCLSSFFHRSEKRLLCPNAPLQSFYVTNSQFHPEGPENAKRPFQGLDMRKIGDASFQPPTTTRKPEISGYQYGNYTGPSVHAPTHAEIAAFFDLADFQKKYTYKQMLQAAFPQLRALLMFVGIVLIPVVPFLTVVFYTQGFEPMEVTMPTEEYFRNFRWNYYGPHLDEHAYSQYLESRRAKKWRHVDVNPEDYIPPQYRGQ